MSSSSEKDIVREMKDGYEDEFPGLTTEICSNGFIMSYQENLCYVCSGDWKTEMQSAQAIQFLSSFSQRRNAGFRYDYIDSNIDYSQQQKAVWFQSLGAGGGVVFLPSLPYVPPCLPLVSQLVSHSVSHLVSHSVSHFVSGVCVFYCESTSPTLPLTLSPSLSLT